MARSRHGRRISSPIRDFAVRYPIISRRNGRPKRPKWNGWKGRRRFDGRIESSLTQRREEKWPKGRFPDNLTQRHKEVGCVRDVAFSLLGERRLEEHTSELQSLMRISYAV